jgi:hypothetical protein
MFPYSLMWVLVFPQAQKGCVPKMVVRRPFANADLCDKLRLQPAALFHCFSGQGKTATHICRLRQIIEWAHRGIDALELTEDPLFAACILKTVTNLAAENQLAILVVAWRPSIVSVTSPLLAERRGELVRPGAALPGTLPFSPTRRSQSKTSCRARVMCAFSCANSISLGGSISTFVCSSDIESVQDRNSSFKRDAEILIALSTRHLGLMYIETSC